MKKDEDPLNTSFVSIIEDSNTNLITNIEEDNMSSHLNESKSSYLKRALKDEIIGFSFVLLCNFTRAINGLLMKYKEKTYPEYFETIPFLFIRATMIIILALSTSYINKEKILKPSEIKFKLPFLIRTNFNFFAVSLFTISIWYLRVSTVQIISSLNPIIVTYLSVIILKEKFYKRYIIGIIVCLLGSLIIINNEKKEDNEVKIKKDINNEIKINGFTKGMITGILCCFGSTLINCAVDICNKVLAKNKIPITTQLLYLGIFTLSYSFIYILIIHRFKYCISYILLSFLQGTLFYIANTSFNFGIQKIDLSKAAPVAYTKVVFVLLLGGVLLGEHIYFTDFVGAGLIITYMLYNMKYPLITI
jgi:drug/metabolite transporter (DMT)-like permease